MPPPAAPRIHQASTPAEIESARALFREYAAWLGFDLCFQDFERELAGLPGDYTPPAGQLLLAEVEGADVEGEAAGCAASRRLEEGICEMKRLFVRPRFRGRGLGRLLAATLIEGARKTGYLHMRLDTIASKMPEARALYDSLGFRKIDPYYKNPIPGAEYMEVDLSQAQ